MNALNKLGGALLAAVLLIAVIVGLQSGSPEEALQSVGRATGDVAGWFGRGVARIGGNFHTTDDLGRSIIFGLVAFAGLILLVRSAREGRGLLIAAIASGAVSVLLFKVGG